MHCMRNGRLAANQRYPVIAWMARRWRSNSSPADCTARARILLITIIGGLVSAAIAGDDLDEVFQDRFEHIPRLPCNCYPPVGLTARSGSALLCPCRRARCSIRIAPVCGWTAWSSRFMSRRWAPGTHCHRPVCIAPTHSHPTRAACAASCYRPISISVPDRRLSPRCGLTGLAA